VKETQSRKEAVMEFFNDYELESRDNYLEFDINRDLTPYFSVALSCLTMVLHLFSRPRSEPLSTTVPAGL
jgi:hypothetical protein